MNPIGILNSIVLYTSATEGDWSRFFQIDFLKQKYVSLYSAKKKVWKTIHKDMLNYYLKPLSNVA